MIKLTRMSTILSPLWCIAFALVVPAVPLVSAYSNRALPQKSLSFEARTHTAVDNEGSKPNFSSVEDIQKDLAAVPCKGNSERLKAVQTLFENLGAPSKDISIERRNGVKNIIVRKQGSSSELIVIGAHYDKVNDGCGAIDNWTGIVTIAHIYKTLKDVELKKTVLFVGFGREEEGLIGSREIVKAIDKSQLYQYCAMINIDSLGLGVPHVESSISSAKLLVRASVLARQLQMPFHQSSILTIDSDSSSFLARKIPAISILGLSSDWKRVLHTRNDQVASIDPINVFHGYRLALAVFGEVENSTCDAFR